MSNLLLCALHRLGKPSTASEILDTANALAMDANWPRSTWTNTGAQKASADLRGMRSRHEVMDAGTTREGGREVPLFAPIGEFDRAFPMPDRPGITVEEHPLNGLTRRQQYALFEAQDSAIEVMSRHNRELHEVFQRHARELGELARRAKLDLAAQGIDKEIA